MIKSISYWSMKDGLAGRYPIDQALTDAAAAGFEGLELCIGLEGVLTPESTRTECERVRSMIDDSGLIVETLASGMSWRFNPTSNDRQVRTEAVRVHVEAIRRAAWLGCKALLFVPGVVSSPIAPDEIIRNDVALSRVREAVSLLLEVAESCQIDLCLENVWNGLFLSPLELAEFIDQHGSERLGVYFDVGNVMRYHQYPPHWIELLGKRIKRVHVKDFTEQFDWVGSYAFCDLATGDVPWAATMAALQREGYDGTLVAEMLPYREGLLQRTSTAMDGLLRLAASSRTPSRLRSDELCQPHETPAGTNQTHGRE